METPLVRLQPGVLVLLAGVAYAMYRQGGYHEAQHRLFASIVLGAGIALLLDGRGRRALLLMGVAVTPLFLSSGLSTVLADDRGDARSTFLTIALLGVALAVGAAVPLERRDLAVDAALVVAAIVAITAIWGVATHSGPWGRITEGVWRGSSSLTYSNAAAGVLGPMAVLAFCLAVKRNSRSHAAVATLLLTGFASTQSRGGALTLALFVIATLAYLSFDRFGRAAPTVVVGTVIASTPLLLTASDSVEPQPFLVILAALIGTAVTFAMFSRQLRLSPGVGLGLLGALAALGGILLATTTLGERLTLRSGTTAGGQDAAVLFGDRAAEWSAAWDQVIEAPFVGHGPGAVDLTWVEGGRAFRALFVHNEYLELAVTHGALGLAALTMTGVLIARRRIRSEISAPLLLAVATYLTHSAVDFLWHVPALPVFFAFLAGLATEVTD